MTRQNHARTHTARAIVLSVLRAIGVVLIGIGLVMVFNRLLFGLWGTGNIAQGWSNWTSIGQSHGIFLGVPLTGLGVLLALLSGWLAHWIVRAPGIGCGRCGYETLDGDGRCSECGYR